MGTEIGKVHCRDCVKGMKAMEAGSVDLVFADPPFNIGYDYDTYNDRQEHENYLLFCHDWIAQIHRVLKDDGAFWLAIGDEYAAELKLIAQNRLPGYEIGDVGFTCRSWVIWYYTFGVHCTHKFTRSHAHLFHFVKDPKRFTFNDADVRVPSARQLVYGDKRANPKGRVPDDTWIIPPEAELMIEGRSDAQANSNEPRASARADARQSGGASNGRQSAHSPPTHGGFVLRPQDLPNNFRADEDVWYFSRVAGTFKEREGWHGCQMPEQLLGRIIRACSNEGEIVLDPFTGSGTTLVTAKKLNRRPVGFEMSKQYAAHASKRLAACKEGEPLDGVEDSVTSAPRTTEDRNAPAKRGSRMAESESLFTA